jgi:hypothetical protein
MNRISVFAVLSIAALPAFAQSLGEQKQLLQWQGWLDAKVSLFQEKCGYALGAKIDPNLVAPFVAQKQVASNYCQAVADGMAHMCDDPTSKAAIAAKVKTLRCSHKAGDRNGSFSLAADGTLSFAFDVDTPNISDKTKAYLEMTL